METKRIKTLKFWTITKSITLQLDETMTDSELLDSNKDLILSKIALSTKVMLLKRRFKKWSERNCFLLYLLQVLREEELKGNKRPKQ